MASPVALFTVHKSGLIKIARCAAYLTNFAIGAAPLQTRFGRHRGEGRIDTKAMQTLTAVYTEEHQVLRARAPADETFVET